jgi:hypothetical protein
MNLIRIRFLVDELLFGGNVSLTIRSFFANIFFMVNGFREHNCYLIKEIIQVFLMLLSVIVELSKAALGIFDLCS